MTADPYLVLGLSATATDAELRAAYRRLVQLHHPDHNAGSAESARQFEQVQEAYAEVRRRRAAEPDGGPQRAAGAPPGPDLDARLAEMEREVRAAREAQARAAATAREARARAAAAAREAAAAADRQGRADTGGTSAGGGERPSDEELGYFTTDDSFTKIIDDAADELLSRARGSQPAHRLADLIDQLTGEARKRP